MLTRTSFFRVVLLSAWAIIAGQSALLAQDDNPSAAMASAPMRAARLTSSQGTVTVTDGNNPTVPAQMNLPLLSGVQIATGNDGQAEIEFEDGSVARLTPNSALSLDRLDIAPGQLFVTDLSVLRGLAYFELRATPEYAYSVNVGGDVVSPVENATVRIDLDEPPASIAVLDGTVQVERVNGFKVDVVSGSTLREATNDAPNYSVTQQIAADSWDQWNADMDQQAAQQSPDSTNVRDNYAGAQGYGWGDLDNQGTWYDVAGQGQVWQPFVADDASFDPYGSGAWVWYPGSGYLWASAYPWGWTPYHCGWWSYYDSFGWGWEPDASCGAYGWGFAGGGFAVNIRRAPRGYRTVRVPIARPGPGRPGPARPVLPVRTFAGGTSRQWSGPVPNRAPRQIAGVTARPIVPGHMSFAAGGGGNSSLHRDFPIDRTTHAPAMGLTSTRPPNVYRIGPANGAQPQQNGQQQNGSRGPQNGQQPAGQRTRGLQNNPSSAPNVGQQQNNAPAVQQPQGGRPAFERPQHTAQQQEGQQNQQQRQTYTPQPVQPQHMQPVQPQHTEPAHPQYMPQPRQNFSPPPSVPRYSPPPQQPHFSPPPQPHVSAPPPSPAPAAHK